MKRLAYLFTLSGLIFLSSCDKDNDPTPTPTVQRISYDFDNVDISGQKTRLSMLGELASYAKSANNGSQVSALTLKDMLANTNYTWQDSSLNTSTKDIASKIYFLQLSTLESWIDSLASNSMSTETGMAGVTGVVSSNSGSKQYLCNAQGVEYAQMIEKGIMGALAYYQATAVYLSDDKMNVDNTSVTAGKGTSMQHHWDEAFGYWNPPIDLNESSFSWDQNSEYDVLWMKYCEDRDELLQTNSRLMNAFIKGREAINSSDYTQRDLAIVEVASIWEEVVASTAIHYLNSSNANFADDALRNHALSEARAFIYSLQFNPNSKTSPSEVSNLLENVLGPNNYTISNSQINQAKDILSSTYSMDNIKDIL